MGPLFGKVVAITRPLSQSEEMVQQIRDLGGQANCYPLLDIHLRTHDPILYEAVSRPVDFVIFTSVNGVRAYLDAREKLINPFPMPKAICVGEKTAKVAKKGQMTVVGMPSRYAAQYLVDLVRENGWHDRRVLIVRGNLADTLLASELRELDCDVIDCIGYDTVPGKEAAHLWKDIELGIIDAVTFLSGSAVEVFAGEKPIEGANLNHVVFGAVGPNTRDVMLQQGLPCQVVAKDATGANLIIALGRHFA